jgi:hypothetical protein
MADEVTVENGSCELKTILEMAVEMAVNLVLPERASHCEDVPAADEIAHTGEGRGKEGNKHVV